MLLVIDVGNTNISMALMKDNEFLADFRMMSKTPRTSDEYGLLIIELIDKSNVDVKDIDGVIISSVVPKLIYSIENAIRKYIKVEPLIVGAGIKTGIKLLTDNPKEVGADRMVCVASAYHTYKRACLIIDFGTATTFDYVSSNGEFKNTTIAPGIGIITQALTSQTAKLPEVEIKKPKSILGKNTVDGMQAGIVYGYIGLVEYIIKKILCEINEDVMIIATGGFGRMMKEEISLIEVYDKNLIFKGLKIIYDKNIK